MTNKEIVQKSQEIIQAINDALKPYSDLYLKYHKGDITYIELEDQIYDKLVFRDIDDLYDMNEMCKMYSDCNCGWYEYETGRVIHKVIIKILYPEDYKMLI